MRSYNRPPSHRTRELADLLRRLLDEYERAHPSFTRAEIRAAVRLALVSRASGDRRAASLVVGLIAVLTVMGVVLLTTFSGQGSEAASGSAVPAIAVGLVVVLVLAVVLMRVSSR